MGELRGTQPDQPPEPNPPAPRDDRPGAPEQPANSNNDPRAIRRAFDQAEHPAFASPRESRREPRVELTFVTDRRPDTSPGNLGPYVTSKERPARETKPRLPDGPSHGPPDLIPPRGEDLAELDAPAATRGAKWRKSVLDRENLDNANDEVTEWVNIAEKSFPEKPKVPPTDAPEARPRQTVMFETSVSRQTMFETKPHGLDHGEAVAALLFTGILLGETVRVTYRKASELKERLHARNG